MYERITRGIKVIVRPQYLEGQSKPDEDHFVWAYTITVENHGRENARFVVAEDQFGAGLADRQSVLEPGPLPPLHRRIFRKPTGHLCRVRWYPECRKTRLIAEKTGCRCMNIRESLEIRRQHGYPAFLKARPLIGPGVWQVQTPRISG